MKCRHCQTPLRTVFVDLGSAPPSNAYLSAAALDAAEIWHPLRVLVCERCWLVQTQDFARPDELFSPDYAYFSSTSRGWVAHAARYADAMIERLRLVPDSLVIEVAANDGYLLRHFVAAGIPCLGIEPTASTAAAAERLGIPVLRDFFGEAFARRLAADGRLADLIVGNNVYAHVPDIDDFTRGLKAALKPGGTITLEFPHLSRLIEQAQFDTIYHEHFSYLSLFSVAHIFKAAGLRVWDVEELPTHGGSLRVFGCHSRDSRQDTPAVERLLTDEARRGLRSIATYRDFQVRADRIKNDLLAFLIEQKRADRTVAAYGAAAKGNTLLNYAGVKPDLLPFVCDAAPSKQGKFLPGSRIPIVDESQIRQHRPDYILILPWNLREEVMEQLHDVGDWEGQFVTAVPRLEIKPSRK
ncbi:class I SAM-dependent methyltransferase [Thiocystis violascens]|uniref:Methylase involved in ubiquinone/menaquinone biosynthesis n=1 Tax=Thiocystis violascens (strain ATCC 17096 / DSM 198 / 6111) TaxID=765911 RepID=I3Y7F4_THIV6|nr:class I SAM-dependent methyltransferase [Thiocystis violascens]AFL72922.1 methylase involved in ubiquinone/menaquinone biosynthesis [Thiocystis violascens DSM 198]